MSEFFSEIPVLPYVSVSEFIKLTVEWIKGISRSSVFDAELENTGLDFESNYFNRGKLGAEYFELRRNIREDKSFSVGFRYDLPDEHGRVWRTESVLSNNRKDAFLTVRVSCKTVEDGVSTVLPKRPFFLKLALKAGWGATDGELEVSDIPRYLAEDEVGLAAKCVSGIATILLPVVYVSASLDGDTIVDVGKLAYDLGGFAHVIVEPTREFSIRVKTIANPHNPYGGAIGVALPSKPNIVRFTPSTKHPDFDVERLKERLISLLASRITRFGEDWYALQEGAAKASREKFEKARISNDDALIDELTGLFNSEIEALKEDNHQLKESLQRLQSQKINILSSNDVGIGVERISGSLPQIYKSEIIDRLSSLLSFGKENSAGIFTDRDLVVFDALVDVFKRNNDLDELKARIKAAGKDTKHAPEKVGSILVDLGYLKSSSGKHHKFMPPAHLPGAGQLSIGKTPSDSRAGLNIVRDTLKALCITNL